MADSTLETGKLIGIHKISGKGSDPGDDDNTLLSKILQTREARQALQKILPDIIDAFTKDTRTSKFIMKQVGQFLKKSLGRSDDVSNGDDLKTLLSDEAFLADVDFHLIEIMSTMLYMGLGFEKKFNDLPGDEKCKIFNENMSKVSTGQTGEFITQAAIIINDMHKNDPVVLAETLEPVFKKWIESVDFGEVRELFDTSGEDGRKLIAMINDTLWRYPTKMIMILSFLPSLLNLIIDVFEISIGKFNELPPDMLSDVVISFIGEINDDTLAKTINQVSELIRKIHTGSALLGDPGSPSLIKNLSRTMERVMEKIDPVTFFKAKIALAETSAALGDGFSRASASNPAFKNLELIKNPEISNIGIRSLNRRLSALELLDDEDMAISMAHHLGAYDVQEMAEVVNNVLRIINRLKDEKPEVLSQIARQLVNTIDEYELSETANYFFTDVQKEFEPAARAVVPGLVSWICDVIKPMDDEYEDEAQRARKALQSVFATQEV